MYPAVAVHQAIKRFSAPTILLGGHSPRLNDRAAGAGLHSSSALGIVAVDHVSFTVNEGEIFGLLGPAGAGKSTLIRMLGTLLLPDSGELRVFGYDVVRQPAQVQRLVNRVSVGASFFKQLTPMQNLVSSARMVGMSGDQAHLQVEELLSRMGLGRRAVHQPMEELSRSQQQKVIVAQALLTRPRLLLLDEPTRGLDPLSTLELLHAIRDFRDDYGTTILLAMRSLAEAGHLCSRVAVMENGRITAMDSPANLQQQYQFEQLQHNLQETFLA
jgi:ABC-2 type transport system ATP-binding protein